MSHSLNRRRFLELGAAGAAALATARVAPAGARSLTAGSSASTRTGQPAVNLFTLGVASGDPTPDGVVLWTRLAPNPLAGGGMPNRPVPVQWEVASDERFRKVVARGNQVAVPQTAHSVHVEVRGLRSGSWYWYRFRSGRTLSPVGRTRTAPHRRDRTRDFAFAFASCQSFPDGFYTAYRHMAAEDLDLVVHLGDYIYEGVGAPTQLRPHEGTTEPLTLENYRNRHAQYKTDPDLQAAHGAFPWLVVNDDHEIDNNWADEIPQDPALQPREAFLARRAAAFQAYYEHMPLRRSSVPRGIDIQLYRRLTFGDLVDVYMLDTRQYRSDQNQALRLDPTRTILGDEQERWLLHNLAGRTARWNVLAQQVVFSQRDFTAGAVDSFSDDAWDNYVADRDGLRDHIAAVGASNPVVLTGDTHANYVADVKANFEDPASATVASELVGTSISTGGNGVEQNPGDAVQLAENPHIKLINRKRGYVRNRITRDNWTADFRILDQVRVPGLPITTRASFVIEEGRPGAVPA
jgi:alkaline phosphatase D